VKHVNHRVLALILLAAIVTAAGCASTSVSTIPLPNVPALQASDPARVQVLRAEPTTPHVKLAEIIVAAADAVGSPPTPQEVDEKLRVAAAKLGANAVVVVQDTIQPGLPVASGTWWGKVPGTHKAREVIGIAVAYR
jgi:hypothetical protein